MEFFDRRTGKRVELNPGSRYILNSSGEPADITDHTDPRAEPHPGDHIARPELLSDPNYLEMMSRQGYESSEEINKKFEDITQAPYGLCKSPNCDKPALEHNLGEWKEHGNPMVFKRKGQKG